MKKVAFTPLPGEEVETAGDPSAGGVAAAAAQAERRMAVPDFARRPVHMHSDAEHLARAAGHFVIVPPP